MSAFKAGTESLAAREAVTALGEAYDAKEYVDEEDVRACILAIHRHPPFEAGTFQSVVDVIGADPYDGRRNRNFLLAIDLTPNRDHKVIFRKAQAEAEKYYKAQADDEAAKAAQSKPPRENYAKRIEALTPADAENTVLVESIIEDTIAQKLPASTLATYQRKMAKKLGSNIDAVRADFARLRPIGDRDENADPKKRAIFNYKDDLDDVDASSFCQLALTSKNDRDKRPTFSQIGGAPVRLDEREGRAVFTELDQTEFWGALGNLIVVRNEGGVRKLLPKDVSTQLWTQAHTFLPTAPTVTYTPQFLPDGTLMTESGYNKANNLLLILNGLKVPKVDADPSEDKMQESLDWLLTELLGEFPFLDKDAAGNETIYNGPSRTHALAMVISPFTRLMHGGITPCLFVNKPQPSTGGSTLAKLPGTLADGEFTQMTYNADDDEMRKNLGAEVLIATNSSFFFENLKDFHSRVLIDTFTLPIIKARLLGHSKIIKAPNVYNWSASGNNPGVKAEMARRLLWVYLNWQMSDDDVLAHPFSKNLDKFALENRALAIHHILTLVRYWQSKGAQPYTERTLKTFEPWAANIGGILQACGVDGFLGNKPMSALDMTKGAESQFIREFLKKYGTDNVQTFSTLLTYAIDASLDIITGTNEAQQKRNFGNALQDMLNRGYKVGPDTFAVRAVEGDGNAEFKLVKVATGAVGGAAPNEK